MIISTTCCIYLSADSVPDDVTNLYAVEVLNALDVPGMPPHNLTLKVGSVVIVLRNLNVEMGIVNGTRLLITELQDRLIYGIPLLGDNLEAVPIPRITLTPSNTTLPFNLHRRQFPVKLAFAMTINKSQGQRFSHVGISLQRPVFAHGQLYVALSRCGYSRDNAEGGARVFIEGILPSSF